MEQYQTCYFNLSKHHLIYGTYQIRTLILWFEKKSNAYKLNLQNFVHLRSNILNIWWVWYDKYVDVLPS